MNDLINIIKSLQGNLTQNEFAKKCGISSSNITRIYQGNQSPSPEFLQKIANAFPTKNSIYEKLMIAAGYWNDQVITPFWPIMDIFSFRLKTLREERGFTIGQLSQKAGVSTASIQKFELKSAFPKNRIELVSLAKALDVNTDYLTGESPYKNRKEFINGYKQIETFSEKLSKMDKDFSENLIYQLNENFDTLQSFQQKVDEVDEVDVSEYSKVFIKALKNIDQMAGVLLRYRNLYSTIQIMDTEHYKLGEVGYKIGVEPLNDNQKVLAYIEVLKEHSEIKLSVFETMDSIKKELLEFCETEFNKYYKEVDDFFPADEADEDE